MSPSYDYPITLRCRLNWGSKKEGRSISKKNNKQVKCLIRRGCTFLVSILDFNENIRLIKSTNSVYIAITGPNGGPLFDTKEYIYHHSM